MAFRAGARTVFPRPPCRRAPFTTGHDGGCKQEGQDQRPRQPSGDHLQRCGAILAALLWRQTLGRLGHDGVGCTT